MFLVAKPWCSTQPEARADGRELMERLQVLLELTENMAHQASSLLQPPGVSSATPNPALATLARQVMQTCQEMRDFCARLRPNGAGDRSGSNVSDENDDDPTSAVRQQLSGGTMEAVKTGVSSILPMLDPPPHTSIFGLDAQRPQVPETISPHVRQNFTLAILQLLTKLTTHL